LEESREETGELARLVSKSRHVDKEDSVEEQDKRTEEQEVEAHRHRPHPQASEDAPKDEGEGDDVELHRHIWKPNASEDAPEDAPKDEGDDDFELHSKSHKAL
jgi:hypothetical protein